MNMLSAFTVVALVSLSGAGQTEEFSPEVVRKQLVRLGARTTLQQLYADDRDWTALMRGIASGTEAWLTLAAELQRVADGDVGEQLELSVGEALEHQPDKVLRVAIPSFNVRRVCGAPDIDDPRYDNAEAAFRAVALRQQMLRTVDQRELATLRNQCIEELERSKAGIAHFYGVRDSAPSN